jgi:hypothetical protein
MAFPHGTDTLHRDRGNLAALVRRAVAAAVLVLAPGGAAPGPAVAQEETGALRHGVFFFECFDTGFYPDRVETDGGPSTILVVNKGASREQSYTVIRKRGGKRKVIFQGVTVPGQTITGDTQFRSGDVFILKEINNDFRAKILVR